jgi:hypothetical protein
MDRQTILERLQLVHRHIAEGAKALAHQRTLIARLREDGHSTEAAEAMLGVFENTQTLHVADLTQLQRELVATDE